SVPLVREELQLRIAFCEPHELPRLIEIIHGEEQVGLAMLGDFHRSLHAAERSDQRREWARLMDMAVDHAEAGFWDARIRWLQDVRIFLEGLREEAERYAGRPVGGIRCPARCCRSPASAAASAAGATSCGCSPTSR